MPAIQTNSLVSLILVVLVSDKCFGNLPVNITTELPRLRCELCGDSCNQCEFGAATMPSCGEVCTKGPGKLCGGPNDAFGICGDGMYCNCNRCYGCSEKTLECNEAEPNANDCPIKQKVHLSLLFAPIPTKTRHNGSLTT